MRERSQTTPRRRRAGPKHALPGSSSEGVGALESPYYTIDNTEDIYGTTLLPSQRCYVDPWDLENYDYVRKKIDDVTGGGEAIEPAYGVGGNSLTPSPTYGYGVVGGAGVGVGMSATMPRPHTQSRRVSRAQCQLECCMPQRTRRRSRSARKEPLYTARSDIYGVPSRYEDYMATMTRQLQLDNGEDEEPEDLYGEEQRQLYNGFGGFSSTSSMEHPSSIGDEQPVPQRRAATLQRRSVPSEMQRSSNMGAGGYGTAPHPRRKRSGKSASMAAPPQIEFPAPPPLSPAYDYCNPYATLPYCSIPDCSECQQQIYAAPPSTLYGAAGGDGSRIRGSSPHHSSGGDSSLYSGIYARKFGLSKKGLLQIDYSCSWNDLDRVMQRHF
ncbi:uncharacterized protein LOC6546877 [Drosophila erecta]|nr:uncharacterized protein LOC6546877 [Drosophila erecta]XP_026836852.1 uncharacterized protein LOC6546877 [Drosophila erecta]KQS62860.1 uncharacterized protein Dere_GG22592, isoform B [Drosophila erecta]KQS62861.1 uncharacterized protein Dere_GG22592, isoform C [Drosophila erecta]